MLYVSFYWYPEYTVNREIFTCKNIRLLNFHVLFSSKNISFHVLFSSPRQFLLFDVVVFLFFVVVGTDKNLLATKFSRSMVDTLHSIQLLVMYSVTAMSGRLFPIVRSV